MIVKTKSKTVGCFTNINSVRALSQNKMKTTFCESQSGLAAEIVTLLSNLMLHLISICEQTLHRGFLHGLLHCKNVFLERVSNYCRLRGCLLASMMGLDNLLLKRLSVRMFSLSLFIYICIYLRTYACIYICIYIYMYIYIFIYIPYHTRHKSSECTPSLIAIYALIRLLITKEDN